jgi:hypothetical protein
MREDIKVWLTFLSEYNGVTVITDDACAGFLILHVASISLLQNALPGDTTWHAKLSNPIKDCNCRNGFGIYFQGKWAQICWPKLWEEMGILKDITFLELFPVVVALCIWEEQLKNKNIIFNIDNRNDWKDSTAVLYVFHVESAIEAFTNESISVIKVARDGPVFRCLFLA